MKKLNNKGFTLMELIATLVILALVMGIGSYTITGLIKSSKEKDYELLVKEIKNAVEIYYQECKYVDNNCDNEITLGFLVTNGYLKGNSETFKLTNPIDNVDISDCKIRYEYLSGEGELQFDYDDSTNKSCPVVR